MNAASFQPLPRTSLKEQVYITIQQAIVAGELLPGGRVRDIDLAAQLGVSRTPVREALQRLEDEGLVETVPGALTRIAPLDSQAARDAFPVVAALHALATRLAVPNLTAEHFSALDAANERLSDAIEAQAVLDAIAADDSFHNVFVAAANNGEIAQALARLMPKVRRLECAQFGSLTGRQSVQQHQAIRDAAARKQATEAANLAEENWLSLGRLIAASLSSDTSISSK